IKGGHAVTTVLGDQLSEPAVARLLGETLPSEATLYVAASMPIRDVEEFFPVRDEPPRVIANRGANGIDGTVSAAFGAAAVSEGPVVLLIGDVALAHDIGGLLAASRSKLDLTIVLLNNDGGGIFDFLAINRQPDVVREHVSTSHGLDFSHAAALYGIEHAAVTAQTQLTAAVARGIGNSGSKIIEVHTERATNRALHAAVESAALDAIATGPGA
ncbi:MAG: 2-succinyl-5-enolpyruvyl-6-hydroxy-3-cyclohexene-1-carboxylic-acid synthase, partial [Solirubrobacterales bacterium]|nr:2-succinyl-5-enolpyruvyl-6-hydroxy-3-cyclohexene-1-carboxylic-acid synthase [Solirubrobacterales bacterium]